MPLPSFLQRKTRPTPDQRKDSRPPPSRGGEDSGPVEAARARARRRLIGAVVLLAVGVVVFPLIFETQPRPVDVETPIEIAARPAQAQGQAPDPAPAASVPTRSVPIAPAEPPPDVAAEGPAASAAGRPAAPASVAPAVTVPPPGPEPASAARTDDGSRARALLDGSSASAPKAPRFVVQAGAYTDAGSLREARAKVEKLGLKTYTQVVEIESGKRTRVRVGPFATRGEAEQAAAKVKAAGLQAAILAL